LAETLLQHETLESPDNRHFNIIYLDKNVYLAIKLTV